MLHQRLAELRHLEQEKHRLRVVPVGVGCAEQELVELEEECGLVVDVPVVPHGDARPVQELGEEARARAMHPDDDQRVARAG